MDEINVCSDYMDCCKFGTNSKQIDEKSAEMKRDEDVLDIDSLTVSHIDRANKCVVSETGTSSITTFSLLIGP